MNIRTRPIMLASVVGLGMGLVCSCPAVAQTAPDPQAIFTLQDESSSITTANLSDRYYTNGIRVGYLSPEDAFPFLAGLGHALWGDGRQRLAVNISQQIYTPADTTSAVPPLSDRPYAGVLLATVSVVQDAADSRSSLGLSVGMVGPAALGEDTQNGFHDLIGQAELKGWGSQLHNEAVFAFNSARVWRLPTGTVAGLETDALPALSGTLGTLRVAVETGLTMRIGRGLDADYGAPRTSALGGGDGYRRADAIGWYVFAGLGGQAVAHDVTLDGNTFTSSRSVKLDPLVGQAQGGFAILAFGTRLTYTQVVQTQEFKHQRGGPHQMGALALSVRF